MAGVSGGGEEVMSRELCTRPGDDSAVARTGHPALGGYPALSVWYVVGPSAEVGRDTDTVAAFCFCGVERSIGCG